MRLLLNHEQVTVLTGLIKILVHAQQTGISASKDSLTEITVEPWDEHACDSEKQYVISLLPSDLQRLQFSCQAVIQADAQGGRWVGESNLAILLQKGLVDRTLEVAVLEAVRPQA